MKELPALHELGWTLIHNFERNGNPSDLEGAFRAFEKSIAICPPQHSLRPNLLCGIATAYASRYKATGNLEDLNQAIRSHQDALDHSAPGNPSVSSLVTTILIATACATTYKESGNVETLNTGIQALVENLDRLPSVHPQRPTAVILLADLVYGRFTLTGRRDDLDHAVQVLADTLHTLPPSHPELVRAIMLLSEWLRKRSQQQLGERGDLDMAVHYLQETLASLPPEHPGRGPLLTSLSATLGMRFQQVGDGEDVDSAIQTFNQMLPLLEFGSQASLTVLNNLGSALASRFCRSGDSVDMELAVQHYERALDLASSEHPERIQLLQNVSKARILRFDRAGDRADLDEVTLALEEALKLAPRGHPSRADTLDLLGRALAKRFEQFGDRVDLDLAIQRHEQALELRAPGQSERPITLNNLASACSARYHQLGDQLDQDVAIQYLTEALDLVPSGHPSRPGILSNLSTTLRSRFQHLGGWTDLRLAIESCDEALVLCPEGHPDRAARLRDLATSRYALFEKLGDRADLDTSIEFYTEAVVLLPSRHYSRAFTLHGLGLALHKRYLDFGDLTDLDVAIQTCKEAVSLCPPGHPARPVALNGLSHPLLTRRMRLGNTKGQFTEDFKIIAEQLQATKSVTHPVRNIKDFIVLLLEEACNEGSRLVDRLENSFRWITVARGYKHPSILRAYAKSLELLATSVTVARSLETQHARLANEEVRVHLRAKDLASDAAAAAIDLNELKTAVELLEQGRAILFTRLMQYRTPLEDLQDLDMDLATEFLSLSSELERWVVANTSISEGGSLGRSQIDEVGRYQQLSSDWSDVVKRIRKIPEFATFLQPTPFGALSLASAEGPAILVNISKYRSDAIILQHATDPEVVACPEATPQEVARIKSLLTTALARGDSRRAKEVLEVLRRLWECIVGPVVHRLRSLNVPLGSRIWWCPTSELCSMPLHAAGLYRSGKTGLNLPDLFISSYTPTLSALIRARKTVSLAERPFSILAVGVAQPEGRHDALSNVSVELERVGNCAQAVKIMSDSEATHDAVLRELRLHPWIHMSCHGHQDITNPFNSHFRLQDQPLTFQQIVKAQLPNAELAFLSACHTATGDPKTPDEGLHLAAALQFVGFRSVVGTLWAMDDEDGPDVAEAFYKHMFRRLGEPAADLRDAAKGVYHITKALRKKRVPFDRWVNFIHVGA